MSNDPGRERPTEPNREPQPNSASGDGVKRANMSTFHALSIPNYRLLWIGNIFTSMAMWIQQTTMGWVVYNVTGSGGILGGVNAVRIIPTFIFTPIAGLTSDRVSRNTIIAVSQIALFTLTFLMGALIHFGTLEVWHLFAFAIVSSTANSFNMPARQTIVFDVVPREVIPNAVALSNLAFSVARTMGPMIGGLMINAFGPANNFFIQGLAYLCVMATVLRIQVPPRTRSDRPRRSFFREMSEGYRFVFGAPQARLLVLMSVINPLLLIPIHQAILPIYATDVFPGGAASFGIELAAIGFGGAFGGLLTASLNHVDRRGLLQLIALFVYSLSSLAFVTVGAITRELWLAVPFLVLAGGAEALFNTTNQTVLQLVAPDHLRGRVVSVLQLGPIVMPIGTFTAGFMSDHIGAQSVGTILSLTAFTLGVGIFIFSARMRRLRLSQLGQSAGAATPPSAVS